MKQHLWTLWKAAGKARATYAGMITNCCNLKQKKITDMKINDLAINRDSPYTYEKTRQTQTVPCL